MAQIAVMNEIYATEFVILFSVWLADDAFLEQAYKLIGIAAQWRLRYPLHHLLNNLCHLLNMHLSQVG